MRRDLVLVALGGNALLRRGEPMDACVQRANVASAAKALGAVTADHRLVVTHGNGPQVGLLALQNDAYKEVAPYPLDVLDAESEGMIGYLLDQQLVNELPDHDVATLLTQVIVDPTDPAFERPTKPVGQVYDEPTARALAADRGWCMVADGSYWRRAVPSPAPQAIVELDTIRLLVDHDVIVVCGGGGGIPVIRLDAGLVGVEAVIDKDATSSLLARGLDADQLVLLTDVPGVAVDWRTPHERWLKSVSPAALRDLEFAAGSMAPKVAAVCDFVEATGHRAAIGSLDALEAILTGGAGTVVFPDAPMSWREEVS
jgi:carbamate kinase